MLNEGFNPLNCSDDTELDVSFMFLIVPFFALYTDADMGLLLGERSEVSSGGLSRFLATKIY